MILLCGSPPASFIYLMMGAFMLAALIPFFILFYLVKKSSLWQLTLGGRGALVKSGYVVMCYALALVLLALVVLAFTEGVSLRSH